MENNILPALRAGKTVVLDRYFYSNACYQGARGLDMEAIIDLNLAFAPQPDLIFIIDVDVDRALARISSSRPGVAKLFEKKDFLVKVRANYLKLAGPQPGAHRRQSATWIPSWPMCIAASNKRPPSKTGPSRQIMKAAPARNLPKKKPCCANGLKRYGRLLVAFSGGKDSFFLLQTAIEALGAANVLPYFVSTPFTLDAARERVAYFQEKFSLPVREIRIDLLKTPACAAIPGSAAFSAKRKCSPP